MYLSRWRRLQAYIGGSVISLGAHLITEGWDKILTEDGNIINTETFEPPPYYLIALESGGILLTEASGKLSTET
ncbi:hypothetical protein UFOVP154_38 [uncultured Caudovirales phage]|uniref:Uncharacterized protein n=1 Tax=uncultured Caudovirales phage TaxID=2100421 RepID=A0A6J5KJV2_9CAUD|nr:hypothetical protein UFOVP8_23 [uncultured Caudovirales phage]CAB5170635.1 hypothetical protein UFOVP154_38 [uncultured Caudovirales phage]